MTLQSFKSIEDKLNVIGHEIFDVDEETYDLFSHEFPQRNLGMINDRANTLELDIGGRRYDVRQSPGLLTSSNAEGTTGAALWKVSPLLAEWLTDQTNTLWSTGILHSSAVLVELGCGITGLIGLAMAKQVSKYVLTDQRSVLKLLQENVDVNTPLPSRSKAKGRASKVVSSSVDANSKAQVAEINWEQDDADALDEVLGQGEVIDMVIVCDCVFNDFLLQPLVTMCHKISARSSGRKTALLIAQQLRSDEVFSAFVDILVRSFRVWRLSDESLPPALKNGSGFAVHLAILR
ncbi:Ribosomal protein lysine methyltransferase [Knufia obscura]|uniref:Ribosomal protein lysine methyltransferase n=1 Tax=Knufia obscura TaxID=1635080 RepID=A0ABR0RVA6_9EURO|nr:Ribosomal protein lysine methyltransferase [Knufia obscura]